MNDTSDLAQKETDLNNPMATQPKQTSSKVILLDSKRTPEKLMAEQKAGLVKETEQLHRAILELRRRLMMNGYLNFLSEVHQQKLQSPVLASVTFLPRAEREIDREFNDSKQTKLSIQSIKILGRLLRNRLA